MKLFSEFVKSFAANPSSAKDLEMKLYKDALSLSQEERDVVKRFLEKRLLYVCALAVFKYQTTIKATQNYETI